jgi:hypothetical protein
LIFPIYCVILYILKLIQEKTPMATKYPPYLSLTGAVQAIKAMYDQHKSREISVDLMPEILQTKQGSSSFPMKIAALQRFGFIDKRPNDLLWLTDLSMQIINPVGNEEQEAKLQAFRKIDVLADLLLKYPNAKLPSADQLKQTLLKTYQIERDRLKQWFEFVVDSFLAIQELSVKSLAQDVYPASIQSQEKIGNPVITTRTVNFLRDTLPSGKAFTYLIEDGYTAEDLEYVIGLFELKKKAIK